MHDDRRASGRQRGLVRAAAAAGIAAAVGFAGVVIVAGLAQPDLPLVASFVSELGAAGSPTAWWVDLAFALIGLLVVLFGAGLAATARLAGVLVVVAGIGFVVMGASPCSPGCPIAVVDAAATRSDAIHNAAAIAGLVGVAAAALELAGGDPGDPGGPGGPGGLRGRRFRRWSGRAGVAIGGLSAAFGVAVLSGSRVAIGVSERVLLVVALAWVVLAACHLLRATSR